MGVPTEGYAAPQPPERTCWGGYVHGLHRAFGDKGLAGGRVEKEFEKKATVAYPASRKADGK